ncbi:GH25 family lysozyme [Lactococcus nasutitermitis]|uniref:GH25 family lysozyme n=1 Tax=Lactococcus nasutitermitis TaxID=1652957 RepID=A0ABV9JGK9_9LACT|nr:GH25 family lysozyme [Lactococcus nasutitermitis]
MANIIDLSSNQAGIDLSKLQIDGAIVKASGESASVNPYFEQWVDYLLAHNLMAGAYHFAIGNDPIAEANQFLAKVKPYLGKITLALDFEAMAVQKWGSAGAKQWLDYVSQQTGKTPFIYMSASTAETLDWSAVAGKYPLWRAQYPDNNTGSWATPWTDGKGQGAWKSVAIYQYEDMGRIAGYGGNLDLNLVELSKADWQALAQGNTTKTITQPTKENSKMIYAFAVQNGTGTFLFDGQNTLAFTGKNAKAAYDHYVGTYKAIVGKNIPNQIKTQAQFDLWDKLYPVKYIAFN